MLFAQWISDKGEYCNNSYFSLILEYYCPKCQFFNTPNGVASMPDAVTEQKQIPESKVLNAEKSAVKDLKDVEEKLKNKKE